MFDSTLRVRLTEPIGSFQPSDRWLSNTNDAADLDDAGAQSEIGAISSGSRGTGTTGLMQRDSRLRWLR
jgi:hypothetical protein